MKFKNIMLVFFITLSLTFMASCGGKNNEQPQQPVEENKLTSEKAEAIFNEVTKDVPTMIYEGESLNLVSEKDGVTINYSFDKPEYFNNEYKVIYADEFNNKLVKLNCQIGDYKFTKEIRVHQLMEGYFNKVFDYIGSYLPSDICDDDLKLQSKYLKDEVEITYTSNKPEFITNEGIRVEHDYDELVEITCHLSLHGFSADKTYTINSQGISFKERFNKTVELIDDFFENTELKEGTKLPTELPNYGGRIRWVCEDPTLIYDYETLHLPKEAKTVRLLCEIFFTKAEYKIKSYTVNLEKRPDEITDIDYVKEYISTSIDSAENYLILYDGTLANINRDFVVDTEHPENLGHHPYYQNTKDGRPGVSQAALDRLVYEGYQLNNTSNVLWIVVHETGMSYSHQIASYLAEYQLSNAVDPNANYEASWNYTVDDHSIYQSYEDTIACWHATDGKTEGGGNYNGIGIELCVNAGGNFEVAMRNDARLMGWLLVKHNLGILNMRQHHDFYEPKDCPNTIRTNVRWFEYLMMISREYISQSILTEYEISYDVDLTEMGVDGIYDMTTLSSGDSFDIAVTIDGETYTLTKTIK